MRFFLFERYQKAVSISVMIDDGMMKTICGDRSTFAAVQSGKMTL